MIEHLNNKNSELILKIGESLEINEYLVEEGIIEFL